MPQSFPNVSTVLINVAERLYAGFVRQVVEEAFPEAQMTVVDCLQNAVAYLAANPVDLFLTGLGMTLLGGDALEFLAEALQGRRLFKRVLVVSARRERSILTALRSMAVDGLFDPDTESAARLQVALRTVAEGRSYWSEAVLQEFREFEQARGLPLEPLTPMEKVVLAVAGGGCDDAAVAAQLGLRRSTVQSVRRALHQKLKVQHRGDLIRIAVQLGFVQFTGKAVLRPGFAQLLKATRIGEGGRRAADGTSLRVAVAQIKR